VSRRTLRRGWFWASPSAGMAGSVPLRCGGSKLPAKASRACAFAPAAAHLREQLGLV